MGRLGGLAGPTRSGRVQEAIVRALIDPGRDTTGSSDPELDVSQAGRASLSGSSSRLLFFLHFFCTSASPSVARRARPADGRAADRGRASLPLWDARRAWASSSACWKTP